MHTSFFSKDTEMKKLVLPLLTITVVAYSQTFTVRGTISTISGTVKNASITFVDENNVDKGRFFGLTDSFGNYQFDVTITSVKPRNNPPTKFELDQNYPNPFSSSTSISYTLKEQSKVDVTIYDVLGRVVKKFSVGMQTAGLHGVLWDGKNDFGRRVAVGIYFYRLQVSGETKVKKMVYTGGSVTFGVQQLSGSSFMAGQMMKKKATELISGTYSVQIQNVDSTQPHIVSNEFNNITIIGDTTLNFALDQAINDHHELWVVGYDTSQPLALHSTDGGLSWQYVSVIVPPPPPSPLHLSFYDVSFADTMNGWIVGDYRHIWHTSDGGKSWQLQFKSSLNDTLGDVSYQVTAIDSLNAIVSTTAGAILRTRDGGQSWQEQRFADGVVIGRLVYVDSLVTYATKPNYILKSENAGNDWYSIVPDSLLVIEDMQFLNRDTGWIAGGKKQTSQGGPWNAFVALTLDGGKSWDFKYTVDYTHLGTVYFFNLDTGITEKGVIYRTTDGGNTWKYQYMDPYRLPTSFARMKFFDSLTGWGVGTFGVVRKTTDGGITWTYQKPGYYGKIFTGVSIIK